VAPNLLGIIFQKERIRSAIAARTSLAPANVLRRAILHGILRCNKPSDSWVQTSAERSFALSHDHMVSLRRGILPLSCLRMKVAARRLERQKNIGRENGASNYSDGSF